MSLIHFNVHKKGTSSKQYTIYDNRNKFLPHLHVPDLAYWHKQELHKQRNVNPGITPLITLMHELPEQCLCMCKIFPCWNCFLVHTGKWNLFIPSNKLRSSFVFPWNRPLIFIVSLVNFLQAQVFPPFLGSNPISVQLSTGTEFRGLHSTKVKWVNTWVTSLTTVATANLCWVMCGSGKFATHTCSCLCIQMELGTFIKKTIF